MKPEELNEKLAAWCIDHPAQWDNRKSGNTELPAFFDAMQMSARNIFYAYNSEGHGHEAVQRFFLELADQYLKLDIE